MKNGPYELIKVPNGYPGKRYRGRYAYEHHVNWWINTGQTILNGYEIHHKNGDHHDNDFSNLQLVTSSEHKKLHGLQRTLNARVELKCAQCIKIFFRRKSEYKSKIKKSKTGRLYCSRPCQYKSMMGSTRVEAGDALLMHCESRRKFESCLPSQLNVGLIKL